MKSLDAGRRLGPEVASQDAEATIDVRGLREFFRDAVHDALERQQVGVDAHTEHYVVNLLTMFSRSEELFEQTPEGVCASRKRSPCPASRFMWGVGIFESLL